MPRMYCSHVAYCTTLDVQTLTTSRLPKRSWQSEVELNLIILDVPTFTTSRLPRYPSSQRWNYVGEKWPMNSAWNARLPRSIQESFTCRKSTTWDQRLYFPSKEGVLRIFSPWKIRRLQPGLNPRTWVPKASTLHLDHRSRFRRNLLQIVNSVFPTTLLLGFCHGFMVPSNIITGARCGVVVKALRYKPAGRGFDSRWCH